MVISFDYQWRTQAIKTNADTMLSKNKLGKTQARAKGNNMKAFDKEWNMRVMLCVENIKILESQDNMTDDEEDRWNFWKQELDKLLFRYI